VYYSCTTQHCIWRCSTLLLRILESSLPITCASLLLEPLVWLRFIVCRVPSPGLVRVCECWCECECEFLCSVRVSSLPFNCVSKCSHDETDSRRSSGIRGESQRARGIWSGEKWRMEQTSHVHNCILVTYDCTNLNSIMFYLCIAVLSSGKRNCMYFVWNWIMWPSNRQGEHVSQSRADKDRELIVGTPPPASPSWLQFNLQFCNLKGHFSVR